MNALELKGGIYDLVAQVNDKELLAKMHSLITQLINQGEDQIDFADELPTDIQKELAVAYEESFRRENLVDGEKALEEIQAWRKKG